VVDSKGILHKGRKDIEEKKTEFALKWEMCLKTNPQGLTGGIEEAMKGADFVSATSTPGPGIIKKEWIAGMAKNPIIFACANPTPEIYPDEAKAGGALIVATGRSDFPNQVNNSLVFPGLFRGVLDVRAKTITDEMCVAAATAIGKLVGSRLGPDFIVPTMDEPTVAIEVAVAAAMKAQEQGIAGLKLTEDEVRQKAKTMIERSQAVMRNLMDKGFIEQPPAASDRLEQAATRCVIPPVVLQVIREVGDAFGKHGDLDLGGPGVGLGAPVLGDDLGFLFGGKRHGSTLRLPQGLAGSASGPGEAADRDRDSGDGREHEHRGPEPAGVEESRDPAARPQAEEQRGQELHCEDEVPAVHLPRRQQRGNRHGEADDEGCGEGRAELGTRAALINHG